MRQIIRKVKVRPIIRNILLYIIGTLTFDLWLAARLVAWGELVFAWYLIIYKSIFLIIDLW